jgi:hypothetical protein
MFPDCFQIWASEFRKQFCGRIGTDAGEIYRTSYPIIHVEDKL